jgi:copper chaperone for superoxide dismutase
MESETTTEFGVNLTCMKCVRATENVLKGVSGVSDFKVDLEKQSVVVTSTKSTNELQNILESTGKRAVVLGTGLSGDVLQNVKSLGAAVAMMGGLLGAGKIEGVIRFVQVENDKCVIDGTIDGLKPQSEHALAIFECGDISAGCSSVGEHFNPRDVRHGSPDSNERHIGDLGNIKTNQLGRAEFKFSDHLIKVNDIIGRSIAVAEGKDDLGESNHPLSSVNGNCGNLLSCGIIARSAGLFQNTKRICACDGVTLWDERDKPLVGPGRSENNSNKL